MKYIIIIFLFIGTIAAFSQTTNGVEKAKGLKVGEQAPNFLAMDADSNQFELQKALKKGPVVLVFYRGFWCPVCNKHLSQLQDSLKLIEATGAKLIAISPEKPEYLNKMEEKTGAQFSLLYDENYKIATAYDVNYKPTSMQLFTYNVALGAKIKKTHTDDAQNLPIPATYIINEKGTIIWRQFDPDYKKRSSVKEILNVLTTLAD